MKTLVLFLVLVCWGEAIPQYAPPVPEATPAAAPPVLFETTTASTAFAPAPTEELPAPPATNEQYSPPVAAAPAPAPPAQQYGLPSF